MIIDWIRRLLGVEHLERRIETAQLTIASVQRHAEKLSRDIDYLRKHHEHQGRTVKLLWDRLGTIEALKGPEGGTLGQAAREQATRAADEQIQRHRESAARDRGMTMEQYDEWCQGKAARKEAEAQRHEALNGKMTNLEADERHGY